MRMWTLALILVMCESVAFSQSQSDDTLKAIRERLMTAKAVAMAKFNSGAAVEDEPRERDVLHRAVRMAVKLGADVELTVKVFEAQIEASKVAQRSFLQRWHGRPKFATVPNLATEIRPKLDALTPVILRGIKHHIMWTGAALNVGPSDPLYREAWRIAVSPFLTQKVGAHHRSLR